MARQYMSHGFKTATKHAPKLRAELAAMSDKAKRRKRLAAKAKEKNKLEANVAENQKRIKRGKRARTIAQRDADRLIDAFRSKEQKARRLVAYAAKMNFKAGEVERSGTGNVKAAATYRRVARGYMKQAAALRGKK